jgi:hypothetical protein
MTSLLINPSLYLTSVMEHAYVTVTSIHVCAHADNWSK